MERAKATVYVLISTTVFFKCNSFLLTSKPKYSPNVAAARTRIRHDNRILFVDNIQKETSPSNGFNHRTTHLFESTPDSKTKAKAKGVYSRPSAAIEKGSGFFVPGLEGSKVRILFGLLVLILNFINHLFSGDANVSEVTGFAFSENVATFYGVFLLGQGIIEFGKEIGLGFDGIGGGDSVKDSSSSDLEVIQNDSVQQFISPTLTEKPSMVADAVCWAAASFLSLTPATNIMLIESCEQTNVLYRLGDFLNLTKLSEDEFQSSSTAAIETVFQSRGGRVSIPIDHPASQLLPEENRRCVLLQKVHEFKDSNGREVKLCLIVGCDQLLVTFTKNDLKWLGSMAGYIRSKL